MTTISHYFPNKGFLEIKFKDSDLINLRQEVEEIKKLREEHDGIQRT